MEGPIQILNNGVVLHNTYVVKKHIASGGFGNTYLVTHNQLNEDMVVKEFFIKGVNYRDSDTTTVRVGTTDNTGLFSSQKDKFKKEAQRIWKLRNDHVVKVHDMFEENDTVYYVMDYIDGTSLASMMKQTGAPFSEEQVRNILIQVLSALKVVHNKGIWHMDIKPENIMMDRQGNCVLIDFGSSKQISSSEGKYTSTSITYTPGYAPMEQMDGTQEKWGPWTDFYALGATLYNLLTKRRPPLTSDITSDGDNAFIYPYPVSPQMRQLISHMMQPAAKNRPQTSDEIMAFISGNVGVHPVVTNPQRSSDIAPKIENIAPKNGKSTVVFNRISEQSNETRSMSHLRQQERSGKRKRLLYISLIAFLIVLAIGGVILLLHSKGKSKETTQELQTAADAILFVNDAKSKVENIRDLDSLNALSDDIQKQVDALKKELSEEDKAKVDKAFDDFTKARDARNEAIEPIIATKAFIKEFTEKCRKVKTVEEFQDLCTELEDRALELEEKYPYFEPTGADSLELVKLQEEFDKVVDEKSSEFEE